MRTTLNKWRNNLWIHMTEECFTYFPEVRVDCRFRTTKTRFCVTKRHTSKENQQECSDHFPHFLISNFFRCQVRRERFLEIVEGFLHPQIFKNSTLIGARESGLQPRHVLGVKGLLCIIFVTLINTKLSRETVQTYSKQKKIVVIHGKKRECEEDVPEQGW